MRQSLVFTVPMFGFGVFIEYEQSELSNACIFQEIVIPFSSQAACGLSQAQIRVSSKGPGFSSPIILS